MHEKNEAVTAMTTEVLTERTPGTARRSAS